MYGISIAPYTPKHQRKSPGSKEFLATWVPISEVAYINRCSLYFLFLSDPYPALSPNLKKYPGHQRFLKVSAILLSDPKAG